MRWIHAWMKWDDEDKGSGLMVMRGNPMIRFVAVSELLALVYISNRWCRFQSPFAQIHDKFDWMATRTWIQFSGEKDLVKWYFECRSGRLGRTVCKSSIPCEARIVCEGRRSLKRSSSDMSLKSWPNFAAMCDFSFNLNFIALLLRSSNAPSLVTECLHFCSPAAYGCLQNSLRLGEFRSCTSICPPYRNLCTNKWLQSTRPICHVSFHRNVFRNLAIQSPGTQQSLVEICVDIAYITTLHCDTQWHRQLPKPMILAITSKFATVVNKDKGTGTVYTQGQFALCRETNMTVLWNFFLMARSPQLADSSTSGLVASLRRNWFDFHAIRYFFKMVGNISPSIDKTFHQHAKS